MEPKKRREKPSTHANKATNIGQDILASRSV
jgi:hypothetical protein